MNTTQVLSILLVTRESLEMILMSNLGEIRRIDRNFTKAVTVMIIAGDVYHAERDASANQRNNCPN